MASGSRSARRRFSIDWKSFLNPTRRIVWLKAVVVVAFVIALVMSAPLWLASRTYPLSPVVNGLSAIGYPLDWILFGAMLVLLFATLVAPKPRTYIWIFLGILAVLCLYDQTRWQPYTYMYGFLLAALTLFFLGWW